MLMKTGVRGVGDLIHYSYHSSGMKIRKETVMCDGYILDHAVFNISARGTYP